MESFICSHCRHRIFCWRWSFNHWNSSSMDLRCDYRHVSIHCTGWSGECHNPELLLFLKMYTFFRSATDTIRSWTVSMGKTDLCDCIFNTWHCYYVFTGDIWRTTCSSIKMNHQKNIELVNVQHIFHFEILFLFALSLHIQQNNHVLNTVEIKVSTISVQCSEHHWLKTNLNCWSKMVL